MRRTQENETRKGKKRERKIYAGETFPGHLQISIGKDIDESSHLWGEFYCKHYLFSEKLRFSA